MKPADRRADSRTAISANIPAWLREGAGGVLIEVHLQPGARRSGVVGEHGGRLKIAVAAPPSDGRANDALIEWVAGCLDLPRRQVSLVAGQRSRDKTLRVTGPSPQEVLHGLSGQ